MKDVITYCADLDALRKELTGLNLVTEVSDDETALPVLNLMKTPVIEKDGQSLSLVRITSADDEAALKLDNIQILGTYDEVFADQAKLALYESVYSLAEQTFKDEDGNEQTFTPPKKFGEFYN